MTTSPLLSGFHDAELIGIRVDRIQQSVILTFNHTNGQTTKVSLANVILFRATDFILQNVTSRLRISSQVPIPRDQILHWIRQSSSLTDTDMFMSDIQMNQIVGKIEAGDLILFILEPSFGAELAAVCQSISLEN